MKMTNGITLAPRIPRRVAKRHSSGKNRPVPGLSALGTLHSLLEELRASVDPCENSSDSGLGFDQHLDYHFNARQNLAFLEQENWYDEQPDLKRRRVDIKVESDDANDFCFPENIMRVKGPSDSSRLVPEPLLRSMGGRDGRDGLRAHAGRPLTRASGLQLAQLAHSALPLAPLTPLTTLGRRGASAGGHGVVPGHGAGHGAVAQLGHGAGNVAPLAGPVTLTSQLGSTSRDGRVQLQMVYQPETQHRARYQTEGSRGAVKDRSGNGFPVVKLSGYNKATTLQVFIGTDQGRVAPHMFYQACRVCGKNSTPCVEKKVDGTVVIEVDFEPSKEMTVTCDCVGILKERNVDVEHRFPDQTTSRSKKKSTRCRMVFRATIVNDDGTPEVLQVTSQPIVCTQPPGVPEICKKSLTTAPCTGGMELFIIGKNFLKDTRVIFQKEDEDCCWKEIVTPDKEFLQQTHLVCTVPPFRCPNGNLLEPMSVRLLVESGGKASEAHTFVYTSAALPATPAMQVGSTDVSKCCPPSTETGISPVLELSRSYPGSALLVPGSVPPAPLATPVPVAGPSGSTPMILPFGSVNITSSHGTSPVKEDVHSSLLWPTGPVLKEEKVKDLMPPPTSMAPPRRPSLIVPDQIPALKTEVLDEPLMTSIANPAMPPSVITAPVLPSAMPPPPPPSAEHLHGVDLRMTSLKGPSMATIQHFMRPAEATGCLPTQSGQSVETFLNRLESAQVQQMRQQQQQERQTSPQLQPQEQSPQQASPLEAHKSPDLHRSPQEQSMALAMPGEPFLSPPSRPAPTPIVSQMENMLIFPPPATTQNLFVPQPSAPIDSSPFLPPSCNTSPIAQKSILNSESPPQFGSEPPLHDDNSNHGAVDVKPSHQHFSPLSNPQLNHMMHNEQSNHAQQMAHLMHDETSNQAQIAQMLHDEGSKDATQMGQVMHDERSNHGVDVKVSAARQMACFLQDERSNHAMEVKTTAAQQLAEILHDNCSNQAIDGQAPTAQQFAQILQEEHSNHARDVKVSLSQSFGPMLREESSNHNKPSSTQDIAQMIVNDTRGTQQLAQMLQEEASNHAADVKASAAQQLAQMLHDEASNAALMAQEEQHNKSQSHLSFSQIFRGEMSATQQTFVPLHQVEAGHSSEMKPYCNSTTADSLLAITNAQATSLMPNASNSLVITQAPSNEQLQVNCITTPSSYNKERPMVISPVYNPVGADLQAQARLQVEAQVQAVQAAHVQAQVEAHVQAQMQAQAQVQAQVQAQMQAQVQAEAQAQVQAEAQALVQAQMQAQAQAQMQVEAQVQQVDVQSQAQTSPHQLGYTAVTTSAGVMEYPILTKTLASGKIFATEVRQQHQQSPQQSHQTTSKPHGEFQEMFDIFQSQ